MQCQTQISNKIPSQVRVNEIKFYLVKMVEALWRICRKQY